MGRIPAFKNNFNDLLRFSLADLKRHGYLIGWYSAPLTWTRNGYKRGSINIGVNLDCLWPGNYVQLDYIVDGRSMSYRIELAQLPSNLGKGNVWYFVCPLTGEHCRTLYKVGDYFASRKAQKGTLYESQTYSKHYRWLDKTFGPELKLDGVYDEVYKRYAKKYYRGKPTPKMRKALALERACDLSKDLICKSLN
ncbi:hypothetical protein [Spirosoma sp.]|uniref:hypothetical protein n=1 Tax=Spirosoma sp. TaxID=1899569 RepID=UPI00262EAD57|nr:hypothetical protein [Spirosoma sp.]MCX6214567.1 hypothetical protein [Spirosoma sp.]